MALFDEAFDARKHKIKAKLDTDLSADDLKAIIVDFKKIVKKAIKRDFPQDCREQLLLSRNAVFMSWWAPKASYYRKMEKISDRLGTACNIQTMVFGNMGDTCCTGVGFTRDPGSGEKLFYGEFLVNAQGEDVVAGIRTPSPINELEAWNPDVYKQLRSITASLEKHYKDMQDFEFTVQEGTLYMLQTRNGKRTGPAAVKVAVDMVEEKLIDEKTAVGRVAPAQLDQLLHPVFDTVSLKKLTKLATGIDASPGAAVGRLAFTSEDAVVMGQKGPVILIRKETTPDDIHGMDASKGILTAVGGKSSHAAVVARGMGVPCVVGCGAISINEREKTATVKTKEGKTIGVKQGDWVSLNGTNGDVYLGQAETKDPDPNSPAFAKFMKMADKFRGKFGVRANADIPRDAKAARAFGAEGIGLCRTEHMFFAEDRLPLVQAMILSENEKDRRKALAKLLPMQRKDFAGLFESMDGFPVVIRTLDPPLHEFVPKREELMVDIAKLPSADLKTKKEMVARYKNFAADVKNLKTLLPDLLKRVESLHEFNPMLGHRGCRLGITYPEITEMQARAIFEAVVQVAKKGKKVIPEVMIPLILSVQELEHQKAIVKRVADEVLAKAGLKKQKYLIGTMIEIPRAALLADQVAKEAEFFSFGTNDLTQTTMGLSRDDYTKFSKDYEDKKIFAADPFGVLDQEGVGMLIKWAVEKGRGARPDLEVGICGEHGGEPSSVMFCYRVGMDYVSCSPYRVPIARLAAAQAAIEAGGGKSDAARTS
jgi:pyruvate,orthophosphate dikinase